MSAVGGNKEEMPPLPAEQFESARDVESCEKSKFYFLSHCMPSGVLRRE